METPREIVKVFTKYDSPIITIMQPYIKSLERGTPFGNWGLYKYSAYKVEQGLEGVSFVYYRRDK